MCMRFASVVYRQGKRLTDSIGCISEVGEDCFPSLIFFKGSELIQKLKQEQRQSEILRSGGFLRRTYLNR